MITANPDPVRRKRLLRLRIARLRRRVDGRAHRLRREGRRLASWKTYVRRYPAYFLLIAAGLGLTASAGLGRGRWLRLLALQVVGRAGRSLFGTVAAELSSVWDAAAPRPPSCPAGQDPHGES